jgi:class 3 adenylate cyclase/CheY-like chemotaxis protein
VNTPPRILVVDDVEKNARLLADVLTFKGYHVVTAAGGREALDQVARESPDLVLLDVMMPDLNGYDVCRTLRADRSAAALPIVMVTALDPAQERIKGLDAGADDFLTKPIAQAELLARVRSLLRIKALHDELTSLNCSLEARVREQVAELEQLGRLKRFFSPQLAELIVRGGADDPLKTHRRDITVVFLDLRGFTAFAETAAPEEVMAVLREYHAEMGRLILEHEGTLERFTGDGMMVFFNDPVPVTDPGARAVRMALAMQQRVGDLQRGWSRQGYELAMGVGIAQGYATIGAIGFEGRWDYGAIGTVTNLAARLCSEAKGGQILVTSRVAAAVEGVAVLDEVGALPLKGLLKPVPTFAVRSATA